MSRTIKAGLLAHLTFGSLPIPSGTVTIGLPMSIEAYSCGYSSGIESVSLTGFPIRTSPCETGRSPLPKTKVTFFRIKPKATERFRRPCVRQPEFFLLFPARKRKPQAVRPLPPFRRGWLGARTTAYSSLASSCDADFLRTARLRPFAGKIRTARHRRPSEFPEDHAHSPGT